MANPNHTGSRRCCPLTLRAQWRPVTVLFGAPIPALTILTVGACDRGYVDDTTAELRRENRELRADIEKLQFRVYQLERQAGLNGSAELTPEELERRRQECVKERGEDNMICMSLP